MTDNEERPLEHPLHFQKVYEALDLYYGDWLSKPGQKFYGFMHDLAVLQKRMAEDKSEPGDFAAAVRILAKLAKGDGKDLVWTLFQLGRSDQAAQFPFQIILQERTETQAMRHRKSAFKAKNKKLKNEGRDYALFLRVIDLRQNSKVTLNDAYEIVARGEDGPLGLMQIQPRVVSSPMVKRAYENNMRRARKIGFVFRRKGMFASRTVTQPLPKLPGKGRPKK